MTSRVLQGERAQSRVVLFVGHGTRVQAGVSEFLQFCNLVERRISEQVRAVFGLNHTPLRFERSFLELVQPDLVSTLVNCCIPGVSKVVIVPLFLFEAGHMKQDVPVLIEKARPNIGSVELELLPAIGVEAAFIDVAVERVVEAGYTSTAMHEDAILFVGRGNKDKIAQGEFEELAKRVRDKVGATLFDIGYLAGTGRDWRDSLNALLDGGAKSIFIQPYLWFHGWLTEQLPLWIQDWQQTVDETGANKANQRELIRVGEPLGVHEALVASVTERVLPALLR